MSRFTLVPAMIVTILAVTISGCSSGFVPAGEEASQHPASINGPTNGLVQSNTGGKVTIDVTWVEARDNSLIFNVAMNTHSVNLDGYDLERLSFLSDDTGNQYQPVSWDSAPGDHHRRGTLTFTLPDSLIQGKTSYLELVIMDVAGVEKRVLRWEL